jgi:hypothetical protein
VAQPVIALRKDVRQPNSGGPSQAETLPIAVREKVLIQQRREAHPFHMSQQERGIIHPFHDDGEFISHMMRIPHFSKLAKI